VLVELWVLDFLEWILCGCNVLYWRFVSRLGRQAGRVNDEIMS